MTALAADWQAPNLRKWCHLIPFGSRRGSGCPNRNSCWHLLANKVAGVMTAARVKQTPHVALQLAPRLVGPPRQHHGTPWGRSGNASPIDAARDLRPKMARLYAWGMMPPERNTPMAGKNLANRLDIAPDALRQRRDLYALAIGLTLFNVAGGKIAANTSFGSLLPLTLERPYVFLIAAWLGFFYFWFRFWLVTDARPFADYLEDVTWQAGASKQVRAIAAKFATRGPNGESQAGDLLKSDGFVPKIFWESHEGKRRVPGLSLNGISQRRYRDGYRQATVTAGPADCWIAKEDLPAFRAGWRRGFFRAMLRERTFTDYTLPHLVAICTVIIGLVHVVSNESATFHHTPSVVIAQPASHTQKPTQNTGQKPPSAHQ